MKLGNLLVIGLTSLALAPSSWALVGGPWDHLIKGTFSRSNTDGLYEASVSMKDGSGFLRFISNTNRATLDDPITRTSQTGTILTNSTNTTTVAGLAARSNTVIFYKGNAYYGSVFGTVNAATKSVNGGGGGQSAVVDQVETSVQQFAQNLNAFVNISGFSESMNITFRGRIVSQIPETRFEANGQAVFFSRPPITVNPIVGATDTLYEIKATATGPIKPDATVDIRLFGGRVNLSTNYTTSSTTGTTTGG
jgi:hypothetical protein